MSVYDDIGRGVDQLIEEVGYHNDQAYSDNSPDDHFKIARIEVKWENSIFTGPSVQIHAYNFEGKSYQYAWYRSGDGEWIADGA